MKPVRLDPSLRDFYAAQAAPEATARRLVESAGGDWRPAAQRAATPPARPLRFWRRNATAVLAIAACSVLAAASFRIGFTLGLDRGHEQTIASIRHAPRGVTAVPTREPSTNEPANYPRYLELSPDAPAVSATRLLVLRVHADWCPRCPTIGPIFDEMAASYGDEPVLFVTLNITSAETRAKARAMIDSLGIRDYFGPMLEPGVIHLIDRREKRVVAEVRARDEMPAMQQALAHALPHGHTSETP